MKAKMQKTMFRLPRLGGSETEARVLGWKKAPGESFVAGETLLEVETDKAVVEVPADVDGVMVQPLKDVDAYADFDEALAEIEVAADAAAAADAPAAAVAAAAAAPPVEVPRGTTKGRVFATPVARKLAREKGIDLAVLRGSGISGRIVRRDVERGGVGQGSTGNGRTHEQVFRSSRGDIHARRWNAAGRTDRATIVLVHGLYGDVDTWAALANSLADAGHPVLAVDLPLHGRTSTQAATLDELVQAVAEPLTAWVPGQKVLVGHSLGGAVAVKLALALDERNLDALALIAPAGLGTEIDQGFIDGMLHAGSAALLRREIDKLTHRPQPFSEARVADMHAGLLARRADLETLVSHLAVRSVQQIDIRSTLEALRVPVSVLWGRLDRVIPWQHALNLPPNVALHLFPDAGHMPQWENSRIVSEALLRLSRIAA